MFWHTEPECQMVPRDHLLNSFGPLIFWCQWGTFLKVPGCPTVCESLAKALKNGLN